MFGNAYSEDTSFACAPELDTLTRWVRCDQRSWTNTSVTPLVSPGTRLVASDLNTTKRPLPLIFGCELRPLPCVPSDATLTRSVRPVHSSCTNTSAVPLVSSGTRLVASES